ncbi:hypothetical protein GMB86_13940 [Terrilactibacillus sp. BCM23-1]|uniref:Uncharacterized protein n=1 Tax=Terrilactibacillus tamarindi TaxID=2599694 RepID=A0A6N8CTT3_9BACI|nr:hypothetical protein [Terrilactibacillus tamarindi]MTT33108.1 hypothetical protein [Terrilactibacillus tamarindi]
MFLNHVCFESILEPERMIIPSEIYKRIKVIKVIKDETLGYRESIEKNQVMKKDEAIYIVNPLDSAWIDAMVIDNELFVIESLLPKLNLNGKKVYEQGDINRSNLDTILLFEKHRFMNEARKQFKVAKKHANHITNIMDHVTQYDQLNQFLNHLSVELFKNKHVIEEKEVPFSSCQYGTILQPALDPILMVRQIRHIIILKGTNHHSISTCLHQLKKVAMIEKQDPISYYCPFYTEDIDMLYLPKMKTAILDGMSPHRFEPIHPKDKIYNLDHIVMDQEKQLENISELNKYKKCYHHFMNKGYDALHQAKYYQNQLLAFNSHKDQMLHYVDENS